PARMIAVGEAPVALSSGDFDGDGFLDVAVANRSADLVTYLLGTAGGLIPGGETEVGDSPAALINGDYDGDGFLDLAVANEVSGDVTYLRGGARGLLRAGEIVV